jgi:hypothetical protein
VILLIVPALILTCMWIVASPVCVVERAGVFTVRSGFLHRFILLCLQTECGFLCYPFELSMPIKY